VTVYFALLLAATLSVYLSQKTDEGAARFALLFIAIASLVLVSSLRSSHVGTDAGTYASGFASSTGTPGVENAAREPGLVVLGWLGRRVYDNYVSLFTLAAIVVTTCFLVGIRRLSVNSAMSVFVLLTSGAFYFSFNGMRQGIATALVFLSFVFIYGRRPLAFLMCIAVASCFHISAAIALPVYLIVPRQNNLRYNVMILVGVVLATLFFSELVTLAGRLNERYIEYGVAVGRRAGLVYQATVVALGGFFLYFRKRVLEHRPLYDVLLNLYLLGVLVTLVAFVRATFVSGVLRMNLYFISSQILLWPIVFANLRGYRHRDLAALAFTGFYVVYYVTYLSRFSNLVPYTFNPVVQGWFPRLF
jgi:hypothetical protein